MYHPPRTRRTLRQTIEAVVHDERRIERADYCTSERRRQKGDHDQRTAAIAEPRSDSLNEDTRVHINCGARVRERQQQRREDINATRHSLHAAARAPPILKT